MVTKDEKNKFRCNLCFYQWVEKRGKRINCSKAYKHWLLGRRTLAEICDDLDVSYSKLNKEFDRFDMSEGLLEETLQDLNQPINLLFENLKIPSTNNQLEGLFSHAKERIKMHRGLDQNRKKKSGQIFAKKLGEEIGFHHPIFLIMPSF